MSTGRDALNIYIPRRISNMTPEDILAEIDEIRENRVKALAEIEKKAEAKPKNGVKRTKKSSITDLSKMDMDAALAVMADQMGITVDELRRIASANH